jgi:hypothetical protein
MCIHDETAGIYEEVLCNASKDFTKHVKECTIFTGTYLLYSIFHR